MQLNCADAADCLLAVGGNPLVSQFYRYCTRNDIIGVFENVPNHNLTDAQRQWVEHIHKTDPNVPSPRTCIHGVLFLFHDRRDTAALSYELSSAIAWNAMITDPKITSNVAKPIYSVIARQA